MKPAKPSRKFRKVRTVLVGEFKAQCLGLMDDVSERHCEIVITKRGKPVARLVPYEEKPKDIFGCLKGSVVIHGDIIGPTGEIWEADA